MFMISSRLKQHLQSFVHSGRILTSQQLHTTTNWRSDSNNKDGGEDGPKESNLPMSPPEDTTTKVIAKPKKTYRRDLLPYDPPKFLMPRQEWKVGPSGKKTQQLTKTLFRKPLEASYKCNRPIENPNERALDQLKPRSMRKTEYYKEDFNAFYDIVIVGGGATGLCTAYFLAKRIYKGLTIAVVEKDDTVSTILT